MNTMIIERSSAQRILHNHGDFREHALSQFTNDNIQYNLKLFYKAAGVIVHIHVIPDDPDAKGYVCFDEAVNSQR